MRKFLTFLAVFSAMKSMAVHPQFKADVDNFIEKHQEFAKSDLLADFSKSPEFQMDLRNLSAKFFNEYSLEELKENVKYFSFDNFHKKTTFAVKNNICMEIFRIIHSKEQLKAQKIVEILEKSENCESDWAKNFDALFFLDKNVLQTIRFTQGLENYAFFTHKLQSLIEIKEMEIRKNRLEHFLNSIKKSIDQENFVYSDQCINDVLSKNLPSMKQNLARIIGEEKDVEKYKNLIDIKYYQLLELQENLLTKIFQSEKEENNYTLKRKAIDTTKRLLNQKENFGFVMSFLDRMIEKLPQNHFIEEIYKEFSDKKFIKDSEELLTETKTFIQTAKSKLFGREIIENQTYSFILEKSRAKLSRMFDTFEVREEIAKLLPILEKLSEDIAKSNRKINQTQTEIAKLNGLIEKIPAIEKYVKLIQFAEQQYLKLQEKAKSINPSNPDENFVQECEVFIEMIDVKIDELQTQENKIGQNIQFINEIIEKANFVPVSEGAKIQEEFRKQLEIHQKNIEQILDIKSQLEALKSKVETHKDGAGQPTTTTLYGPDDNTGKGPNNGKILLVINHKAIAAKKQAAIDEETKIARIQREYLEALQQQHIVREQMELLEKQRNKLQNRY